MGTLQREDAWAFGLLLPADALTSKSPAACKDFKAEDEDEYEYDFGTRRSDNHR